MSTASKVSQRQGKDVLKVIRKTNAKAISVTTHTILGAADYCVIRNVSDVDMKINFNTDDMSTNYWTLKVGETSPVFQVFNGADINYQTVSGNSKELQIMLWA